MIPVTTRAGQTLGVFGLGHTGRSVIQALRAGGAERTEAAKVWTWDDRPEARAQVAGEGIEIAPPEQFPWDRLDALVLSPGVPLTHPAPHTVVELARRHRVPVIGDTELFVNELALCPGAKLVAVTGTNGKSTTTALIGHLLSSAGRAVQVGGNIGDFAVLELKPPVNQDTYVIEFSSYQLDLTPGLMPQIAVFLNLSPDHLDRHGGFEGYGRVKAKVFSGMQAGGTLVLGMDDPHTAAMGARCPEGVVLVPVSQDTVVPHGVYATGSQIFDATGNTPALVADLAGLAGLRGLHNRQNATAAVATVRALGVGIEAIAQGLKTFPGLAHRMQQVGRFDGVLAINDSKATNAEAAAKALASFNNIFWIAGGRAKAGGISTLTPYFDRIARAYLIGEAAREFGRTLEGAVDYVQCQTLDEAVAKALTDAKAAAGKIDPVVLLSPAAASFDQFASFEARGEAFCAALRQLAGNERA